MKLDNNLSPRMLRAVLAGCFIAHSAMAQGTDTPIRLVVPGGAGSSVDIVARILTPRLSELIQQQVVVDNRPGAGGMVAAQVVAKSRPDGATLLMGTVATHGINPSLYKNLPYDPVRDFEPVVALGGTPNVLVARNGLGVKTLGDFVAAARQSPRSLNMGSTGIGTTPHLSSVMLNKMAGIQTLHVPFSGNAVQEVVAGRIDAMFESTLVALPYIRSGRLVALAVTSPQRSPWLPEVPTVAESGYSGYSVVPWAAIFAPAGTAPSTLKRINEGTVAALKDSAVAARLSELGFTVMGGTQDQLRSLVHSDLARWPDIVRESGASTD